MIKYADRSEAQKEKDRASWRRWYRKNAKEDHSRVKAWKRKNKTKVAASNRKYQQANKEKVMTIQRLWRLKNADHVRASLKKRNRRWKEKNPERRRFLLRRYGWRKRYGPELLETRELMFQLNKAIKEKMYGENFNKRRIAKGNVRSIARS